MDSDQARRVCQARVAAGIAGESRRFALTENCWWNGDVLHLSQKRAYFGTPLELFAGSMKLRLNGPMPFTCKIVSPSIHAKW